MSANSSDATNGAGGTQLLTVRQRRALMLRQRDAALDNRFLEPLSNRYRLPTFRPDLAAAAVTVSQKRAFLRRLFAARGSERQSMLRKSGGGAPSFGDLASLFGVGKDASLGGGSDGDSASSDGRHLSKKGRRKRSRRKKHKKRKLKNRARDQRLRDEVEKLRKELIEELSYYFWTRRIALRIGVRWHYRYIRDKKRRLLAEAKEERLRVMNQANMMGEDRETARYERHVRRVGVDGVMTGWRTIYIFISSTFRDMHAERNVMTQDVFPVLNERSRSRRVQVVPIDLRWGLTAEQCEIVGALELCLQEINRSIPFFVALIGSRYGWRPPDYPVSDDPTLAWVKTFPAGRSITELEIQHGFLRSCIPRHAFTYCRNPTFLKDVPPEIIGTFTSDKEDTARLETLKVAMQNHPFNKMELEYPCTWDKTSDPPRLDEKDMALFRDTCVEDLWNAIDFECPPLPPVDPGAVETAEHLKHASRLTGWYCENRSVYTDIVNAMRDSAKKRRPFTITAEEGGGKSAIVARIFENLPQTRAWRLHRPQSRAQPTTPRAQQPTTPRAQQALSVVSGAPSVASTDDLTAMSAAMTNAMEVEEELSTAPSSDMGWWSYSHFVGCTPTSRNVRYLVIRLCTALQREFDLGGPVPESWAELKRYFSRSLVQAGDIAKASGGSILIAIDGLDELTADYDAHSLEWLPSDIGDVVMLLSTSSRREDAQCLDAIARRQPPLHVMPVPHLEGSACIDVIVYNITHYRKHLTREQLEMVAAKSDSVSPLYLRIICEELRLHGEYGFSGELVDKKINELSNTTTELVGDVLYRLEQYAEAEVGGAQMIGDAMCLIYCSNGGLLEKEILALLAPPGMVRLQRQTWMKLVMMFSDYMHIPENTAEGRFRFFHVGFRKAVRSRYLSLPEYREKVHSALCCYFLDLADPAGDGSFASTGDNPETAQRALENVVYHAMRSGRLGFAALDITLCNISFLQRICVVFSSGILDLVHDYHRSNERLKDVRKYAQSFRSVVKDGGGGRRMSVALDKVADLMLEGTDGVTANMEFQPSIFWPWNEKRSSLNSQIMPLPTWYAQIVSDDVHNNAVEQHWAGIIYRATLITRQADTDCKLADVGEDFRANDDEIDTRKSMKPTEDPDVKGDPTWIIKVDNGTGVDYFYNTRTQERREFIPARLTEDDWRFYAVDYYHDDVWQRFKEGDGCVPRDRVTALKEATMQRDVELLAEKEEQKRLDARAKRRRLWEKQRARHDAAKLAAREAAGDAAWSDSDDDSMDEDEDGWTSDMSLASTDSVLRDELVDTLGADNAQLWLKRRDAHDSLNELRKEAEHALTMAAHSRSATPSGEMVQQLAQLFGRRIRQFADFLRSDAAMLATHNELMCQRATHEPPGTAPEIIAKSHLAKGFAQSTWMTWRNKPKSRHLICVHEVRHEITCICFGYDSKSCAYGLQDGSVHIVAVPSLSITHQMIDLKPMSISCLCWCRKHNWLAAGTSNGDICIWNVATGLVVRKFFAHTLGVTDMRFSHNNKFLASVGMDAKLSIWLTTTFDRPQVKVTLVKSVSADGENAIRCLDYAPNDKLVATGTVTGEIHLWDVQSPSLQVFVEREMIGHTDEVTQVSFDSSGTQLISSSLDMTTRVWDPLQGACTMHLTGDAQDVTAAGFEKSASTSISKKAEPARRALTASVHGVLLVWDLKRCNVLRPLRGHRAAITSCAFAPSNAYIMSASEDKTLRLWSGEDHWSAAEEARLDNEEAQRREENGEEAKFSAVIRTGTYDSLNESDEGRHTGSVTALAASSTLVASGGDDASVFVYDRTTGAMLAVMEHAHTGAVTALAFSVDGDILISGSADHRVMMWNIDIESKPAITFRTELVAHSWGITSLKVIQLPDHGPMLLTTDRTGLAVLWGRLTEGQPQQMCRVPTTGATAWCTLALYIPPSTDDIAAGLVLAEAAKADAEEGNAFWFEGGSGEPTLPVKHNEVAAVVNDTGDADALVEGEYEEEDDEDDEDDEEESDAVAEAAAAAHAAAKRIDEFLEVRTQIPTLRWCGLTTSGKRFSYLGTPGSDPDAVAIVLPEEEADAAAALEADGTADGAAAVAEGEGANKSAEPAPAAEAVAAGNGGDDDTDAGAAEAEVEGEAADPAVAEAAASVPSVPSEWMMQQSSMRGLRRKGLLGISLSLDDIDVWAFSPETSLIAGGADDGKVWLWQQYIDGSVGAPILLGAHDSSVLSLAFSPCGTALMTGGGDLVAFVWDTLTGSMMGKFCCESNVCSVTMIDRTVCVCGDTGGQVYVLEIDAIDVGSNALEIALQRHHQKVWYEDRIDDRQDEWLQKYEAWKDARRARRKAARVALREIQTKRRLTDSRLRKKRSQLAALEAKVEKAEKAMEQLRAEIASEMEQRAAADASLETMHKEETAIRLRERGEHFVTAEEYMWATRLDPPREMTFTQLKKWYAVSFASILHDQWRERYRREDGTNRSRIKVIGGFEFDIANLNFEDLPERYQYENFESAKIASEAVCTHYLCGGEIDASFMEDASAAVHNAWMKRNKDWAPASQMVLYQDLDETEKEKDRVVVREALSVLLHCPKLGPRIPPWKVSSPA